MGVRAGIIDAYGDYEEALRDIRRFTSLANGSDVLTKALLGNYALLDRGRPLEGLRNSIFQTAVSRNYRCPLCERAQVCALDHFLPKNHFPEYSILADNLIPVCERCNRLKGDECDRADGLLMFHAYFDEFPDKEILFAKIDISNTVSIKYSLHRSAGIDNFTFERVKKQFEILGLLDFYQMEAVAELTDQVDLYAETYNSLGDPGLRSTLTALTRGAERKGVNHWKAALYRALSRSSEFCSGGYRKLLGANKLN
ncbi:MULTISPECIES: HNH endonuclease [Streptomyces]|uniref:HNH endonuclease n=1 Tax=Streptomyces TaxID=1883 RepID=UPI0029B7CDDD|nr:MULTISPECIES: HNH endonuclease signature motif containing protein [unclassified Streptomyces]MDX3185413.1 HNH endonuclease signature motif containing protein [Streptomyces sp. ME02-7008A-1]MDX3305762.1 HNH endonuclease signature motif containing protein [Streptomyces sp. ME02-7008A]